MTIMHTSTNGKTWHFSASTLQLFYWVLGCFALVVGLLTPFVDWRAQKVGERQFASIQASLKEVVIEKTEWGKAEHARLETEMKAGNEAMRAERMVQIQAVNQRLDDIYNLLLDMKAHRK